MSFLELTLLDVLDILLVAFLLYQLYRLIKDTVAINVLIGVAAIFVIWKLVQALQMELLSEILGKFIGVGVIALVIVFQQEIRKFLLVIGSTNFTRRRKFFRQLKWLRDEDKEVEIDEIVSACEYMSRTKTGALMVIERESKLGFYRDTGTEINAKLSARLLESIFNKHSPLHDGAVIISGDQIVADKTSIPSRFGLRHRAAIGITEKTNALALVVSEETGEVSLSDDDEFINKIALENLRAKLEKRLKTWFSPIYQNNILGAFA